MYFLNWFNKQIKYKLFSNFKNIEEIKKRQEFFCKNGKKNDNLMLQFLKQLFVKIFNQLIN